MLTDSEELRAVLSRIFSNPKLIINDVARPSGQRVVYFAQFEVTDLGCDDDSYWINPAAVSSWGNVVVKVSKAQSAQGVAYLQREIDILNSLRSKSYPVLYYNNVYSEDPETEEVFPQRLFVSIEEMVESRSLSELKGEYVTQSKISALLIDLVAALRHIWEHDNKFIHRDIKPDNILVRSTGEVVIIDLGIVREEGEVGVTNTYAQWGPCTPFYASPEQATNSKLNITFKSDFFSLGTLAYELATGVNPFGSPGDPIGEVLDRVVNYDPPRLDETPGMDPEFSEVIAKMMAKEPYKRYRKIESLIEALQNFI